MKQRIEARLKATGKSARGASIDAGLDGDTIRNIQRGRSRSPGFETIQKLAKALNCSVPYLTGRVPNPEDVLGAEAIVGDTTYLPVISDVEAGRWTVAKDPFPLGGADEHIGVNYPIGKRAFVLRIKGSSMSPEFADGDMVVIDPDIEPRPGDYVVAKLDTEETATFKKYRHRGKDKKGKDIIELVPLNLDYPTLVLDSTRPGKIVGVMVEHRRFRRP